MARGLNISKFMVLPGILFGLAGFLLATETGLANDVKNLKQVEQEIKQRVKSQAALEQKAKALETERERLQRQIIVLAARLQDSERKQNDLADDIRKLNASEQEMLEQLTKDRRKLAEALAALQKFETQMPSAFTISPDDALSGIRGAIAISSIVPALQDTADKLKIRLEELATVRRHKNQRQTELEQANLSAEADRQRLAGLVEEKRRDARRTREAIEQEKAAINELARKARSLRDLVDRLEKRRTQTTGYASFKNAKGKLPLPVSGRLMNRRKTAEANEDLGREGLYVRTKPGMLVTAPFDADILYAGRFRDYGNILILGVGEGYHMLLSGIGRIDAEVSQQVLAGEPLGNMQTPGNDGSVQETLTLYIEIRYKGNPVTPYRWFSSKI
ncbi:MAG: murein hydrolase activator EnvC family protein [Parvibaculales bacterium]